MMKGSGDTYWRRRWLIKTIQTSVLRRGSVLQTLVSLSHIGRYVIAIEINIPHWRKCNLQHRCTDDSWYGGERETKKQVARFKELRWGKPRLGPPNPYLSLYEVMCKERGDVRVVLNSSGRCRAERVKVGRRKIREYEHTGGKSI